MRRPLLLRDLHAGHHLELFLVSAVSAVLAIRLYLRLTNYPKVGGEALHVAHMLWGGLLMLAALIVLLGFIGESSRRLAAFTGGVGFGTFIDEVGKFVTHDNDYFFRPAVALIYVTFVLTYLALRSVRRRRDATHQEYLVNALQELEQAVVRDLQPEERDRALHYLSRADAHDPLVTGLRRIVEQAELRPAAPGLVARSRRTLVARYRELARRPAFARALIAFFVAQIVIKLVHVGIVVTRAEPYGDVVSRITFMNREVEGYSIVEWLQLGSSLVAAAFVAIGVALIRRSRLRGLRMFQRAILVSIFLTQVFMFYHVQWEGLIVLAFNLLVLLALEFMIEHERRVE